VCRTGTSAMRRNATHDLCDPAAPHRRPDDAGRGVAPVPAPGRVRADTRDTYGRTLAALVEVVGADADVAAVTTELLEDDLFDVRWAEVAATTYNRHRAALLSFFG
jgi:hypothetical protein